MSRPPAPSLPGTGIAFSVLVLALLLGAVGSAWGSLRAPSAYGYATGTDVVATTSAGAACEVVTVRGNRGRGGTTCPATWEADGERVTGSLTSRYGAGGAQGLTSAGSHDARAWGTTAAVGYDRAELWWGLLSPLALVVCVGGAVVAWRARAGLLDRSVQRRLARGESVPWGPFGVRADGLATGGRVLPWRQVRVVEVGTVPGRQGRDDAVTLDLAGQPLQLTSWQLPEVKLFARVVRRLTGTGTSS